MILVADERRWEEPTVTGWRVVRHTQLGPLVVTLTLTLAATAVQGRQLMIPSEDSIKETTMVAARTPTRPDRVGTKVRKCADTKDLFKTVGENDLLLLPCLLLDLPLACCAPLEYRHNIYGSAP
eukprot:349630-Chlamydomonas_euryale.AAC.3